MPPPSPPFERILAYDRWANGEALKSLEAMREPPAKAVDLLAHLLGAQVCWMERATVGRDEADWERWERMDVAAVRRAWEEELPRRWAAFFADPEASRPTRAFRYVNFLGDTGTGCVEDALWSLMFHSAHHRGQVATAVRAAGGTPADTGYRAGVTAGAIPSAAAGEAPVGA